MAKKKLDVGEWHEKRPARNTTPISEGHDHAPIYVGIVGTLIVHLFVLQSLPLLGYHATKAKRPLADSPDATDIKSEAVASETLILIHLSRSAMNEKALQKLPASVDLATLDTIVTLISQTPLPHVNVPSDALLDDKDTPVAGDSGDTSARAALFGRYTVQVDARVERAWRRPRSPINPVGDSQYSAAVSIDQRRFECEIRTTQDDHGNVEYIEILTCNGSEAWQQSLVRAILSASPLPAPPSPSVFSHTLTMTFTADEYAPGASADEYESNTKN